MTGAQRRWHVGLWAVLGPLALAVLVTAVAMRSPVRPGGRGPVASGATDGGPTR